MFQFHPVFKSVYKVPLLWDKSPTRWPCGVPYIFTCTFLFGFMCIQLGLGCSLALVFGGVSVLVCSNQFLTSLPLSTCFCFYMNGS
ncbi:hypothetical protein Hdeb2414_s0006g00214541 [Helianthus debilis subsp. tardiflorus]